MKKYLKSLLAFGILMFSGASAHAQYYQIANQLPSLINPAISGSLNYKGFVDASYLFGVGNYRMDILNISTSQGFRYSNWFYMGVGIGVDIAFSHTNDNFGAGWTPGNGMSKHGSTQTGVMVPVFTDFRFNVGGVSSPSFYADIRLGASFLMGDNYLAVGNGFLTNREYFYLKPSIGVRIPISKKSSKQALDIGFTYQLLTSNYWYNYNNNVTVNAVGATVAFEW